MHEVRIPTLGESVTEGVIVRWIKNDGDRVALDEPLLELETDKASVEIPAPAPGLLRVDRAEGETVQVGEVVARIAAAGDAPTAANRTADTGEENGGEAPKAAVVESPAAGHAAGAGREKAGATDALDALSPAVRRLVEEHDLDPAAIEGSGRGGRISKADVTRHLAGRSEQGTGLASGDRDKTVASGDRDKTVASGGETEAVDAGEPAASAAGDTAPAQPRPPAPYPAPSSAADAAEDGGQRQPMTRLRRRIAERMLEAQRGAAILTTFNEVDMSAVLELRNRFRKSFEERHGVRLGFMSFFARACIAAIADVPLVNARIDDDEIVQPSSVNLGVAVGTPRGLVVPVLHRANEMSFAQIESEIARLAGLAQDNKLAIADLSGGTFTISNGGVYGSLMSTPILNPPQSGILGMHKVEKRPVVIDDEIVIRPMMYLALSYDHRLIDGADAVTFLVRVKERIEQPERLLLEV